MLHDKSITRGPDADEQAKGPVISRPAGDQQSMIAQVMDAIEQGIIIFDAEGACRIHNHALLPVLGVEQSQIRSTMTLEEFLIQAAARGEFDASLIGDLRAQFATGKPFQYDCSVGKGRLVSASVRPVRGGGHVIAFSDVTAVRNATTALATAKAEAEEAQRKAAEILEAERARQREASLLSQMDEWLQSCKSLSELYGIVTAFMTKVLPGTRGRLFIFSSGRDILEQACSWNCEKPSDHLTPDSCWALRRGRSYTYQPERLGFVCDHIAHGRDADSLPEKFTCVPIVAHGNTVGLMSFEFISDEGNPNLLNPDRFTTRCAEHISMAIANVKLRDELQDQSTKDPLTGLYNRRHFLEALRRELIQTAARQGNFALLTFDADHFKKFNDEYGHDAGDAVLEAIAQRALAVDHPGTVPCRVGGEEFSVVLPNADRTRASEVIEDLRQAVEEMRVKYIGGPLPKVTISAGVSVYPTHGTDAQSMIKEADVALYNAKNAGRNCWRIADADNSIIF